MIFTYFFLLMCIIFIQHGMGQLRIRDNGIRVEGDSEFLQGLYASSIRSYKVCIMAYVLNHAYFTRILYIRYMLRLVEV